VAEETTSSDVYVRGKITDDGIEKMQKLIGYPNPTLRSGRRPRWYRNLYPERIAVFCESYGDDNPLFCDEEYGLSTRWQGQIAPPTMGPSPRGWRARTVGDELRRETRGALRGVHLFHSGSESYHLRPVRPMDTGFGIGGMTGVEERPSRLGGRSVLTINEHVSWNQRGEMATAGKSWFIHTEREASASSDKLSTYTPPRYTTAEVAGIDEDYENESRRGAATLYWEDVKVGDQLPGVVKGPMRVTDIISAHIGLGWGNYGQGAFRMDYINRKNMPSFYGRNEYGAWDSMQRLHYDPQFAKSIGVPNSYDYGFMRTHWLYHALTNYVGDDGWVYRMYSELRGFNYIGDTTWVKGEVTEKRIDGLIGPCVEVEVRCVNQRGEVTAPANATLLLASREHGPVKMPPAVAVHEALAELTPTEQDIAELSAPK
jgi:acyl dehydratase